MILRDERELTILILRTRSFKLALGLIPVGLRCLCVVADRLWHNQQEEHLRDQLLGGVLLLSGQLGPPGQPAGAEAVLVRLIP
jgi:hypothetical protein